MRIVVLRHGETAWNDEGRMQGWAPVPLNETGREQATAAGRHLAGEYEFDAVYASDLERTRETTERVATMLPATNVEYDSAFRERDVGMYQGLTYDTVFEKYPRFALGKAAAEAAREVPESGESLVHMYDRVTDGIERIADREHDTVLLVTHGGPIHLLHGYAKEMDVPEAMLAHEKDNCGINVFDVDETIESVTENHTPWR